MPVYPAVTKAQILRLSETKPGPGAHGRIVRLDESLKVKSEKSTFLEESQRILRAMTIPGKEFHVLRALEVWGRGSAVRFSSSLQTDRPQAAWDS